MKLISLTLMTAALATAAPAMAQDASKGEMVFKRCAICHASSTEAAPRLGPNLAAVVGRKSAAVAGYAYSSALVATEIIWDEQSLNAFLEKPQTLVPGNKMAFPGVANAQERQDLIAYLATLK